MLLKVRWYDYLYARETICWDSDPVVKRVDKKIVEVTPLQVHANRGERDSNRVLTTSEAVFKAFRKQERQSSRQVTRQYRLIWMAQ